MKKILLVSGCSYTDPNYYSIMHPDMNCNWPMWPELLAEKLNMQCVNLAMSGAGNEYIYSTLLDYITTNDTNNIGLVIAAWTQNQRKDYQKENKLWTNLRVDPHGHVYGWMYKSLRYYVSFKILCEHYKLPYANFQMLHPFKDVLDGLRPGEKDILSGEFDRDFRFEFDGNVKEAEEKLLKIILKYDTLLDENFLGWPMMSKLGGWYMNDSLKDYKISELDKHPNSEGQKLIMEKLYDRLEPRILN
jgi:hypothetical protein